VLCARLGGDVVKKNRSVGRTLRWEGADYRRKPSLPMILAMQIIKQAAAAVDHLQQAAAAVVVFLVGLEVLGQVRDARAEKRDLDFRRAGILVAAFVLFNDALVVDGHDDLVDRRDTGRAQSLTRAANHRFAGDESKIKTHWLFRSTRAIVQRCAKNGQNIVQG